MAFNPTRIGKYPIGNYLKFNVEALSIYPVYLCQSGTTELCRNVCSIRHDTGFWSLEYVQEGEFFYSDETESFTLKKGDFFLLKPTGSNLLRCVSEHGMKYCLGFHGRMLIPLLEQMRISITHGKYFRSKSPELAGELQREAADFFPGNDEEQREKNVLFTLKVMMMVRRSLREMQMPRTLLQILDYISSHPGEHIRLETLADVAGITVVTVIRLFSAYLKTTPGEYIRRKRLESAAEMLGMPEYSIKEVSSYLGYSSPQYLSTDFKKRYGVTPRDFQRKQKNAHGLDPAKKLP